MRTVLMKTFTEKRVIPRLRQGALALSLLLLAGCVTTGDTSERKVDYAKAEKTHIQAGFGYLRQEDREAARRHFQKALELNKRSAGAYHGLAYLHWGENNMDRAEADFRKALSLQPDFAQARNNYGSFLYSQLRYEEAEQQFRRVSQDFVYDGRQMAMLNLGRTEVKLGKTDDAMRSFKQVISINNRLADPYLELSDLYFAAKDYVSARQNLEQYNKLAGQNPRSLWLGIRLERIFGNKDKEGSYALALKNLHPYSAEYLEYKNSVNE